MFVIKGINGVQGAEWKGKKVSLTLAGASGITEVSTVTIGFFCMVALAAEASNRPPDPVIRAAPSQARDPLDTTMFPKPAAIADAAAERSTEPSVATAPPEPPGILPLFRHVRENRVADLKFVSKTIARCAALGAAFFAYARLPHIALVGALLNIGLSMFSDLCEKEIRERQEKRIMESLKQKGSN